MDSLIEPSPSAGATPDTIAISNVNLSLGSGAARVHILKDVSLRIGPGANNTRRPNFPAASRSAGLLPAPSSRALPCWSPTSRPAISTPPAATRSWNF
jgi:hypothetical protein